MGWKTDWLYQLIFRDIEDIWRRVVKDGEGSSGPAPDYLVISQFANLSTRPAEDDPKMLSASCVAPVLRQWIFDDAGIKIIRDSDTVVKISPTRRGMFYKEGSVTFCISPDRKVVVIQYVVGPRYGLHRVLRVSGQGKKGKLVGHPDFGWWVS